MALNLNSGVVKEKTILISVNDPSIDWDSTQFEEDFKAKEEEEEERALSGVEAKKAHYKKGYDITKLAFFVDQTPTCFIFKNPERYEVGAKLTDIFVSCAGVISKKEPIISDINKRIWNNFFVGYYDGRPQDVENTATTLLVQKPFINGNIKPDFLQSLYQIGILDELANGLQSRKKN